MDPNSTPIPFGKLKLAEVLVILAAAVGVAKADGLISTAGDFAQVPATVWAKYAADVVAILKEQNVAIPENVDKMVAAAPMLLTIFGIK